MNRKINIDFAKNKKYYFMFSGALILIGIILNFVFPPSLDIQFTGGAMLKYSYTGVIDTDVIDKEVTEATDKEVSVNVTESMSTDGSTTEKKIVIKFSDKDAVNDEITGKVLEAMKAAYPDDTFELLATNSVDRTMGKEFMVKCIVAIVLAALFMVLYVAFRFRKIGGWSAGICGIIAILHDVLIVYFAFVLFRYPIDDNFIAVVLSIIGFSLNDTVVIFDRIRENRKVLGPKASIAELANCSTNQTLGRTIYTSVCVFLSVAVVAVVAAVFGLDSVITFAVPMLFGVVSGSYSSICISVGLWILWNEKYAPKFQKKAKKSK